MINISQNILHKLLLQSLRDQNLDHKVAIHVKTVVLNLFSSNYGHHHLMSILHVPRVLVSDGTRNQDLKRGAQLSSTESFKGYGDSLSNVSYSFRVLPNMNKFKPARV